MTLAGDSTRRIFLSGVLMGRFRKDRHCCALAGVAMLLAAAVASGAPAGNPPAKEGEHFLRQGDRVVFYGDSITEQAHYTRPVELYVRTQMPKLKVSFVNRGWSGDRAWGGDGGMLEERLARDVVAHRPTVVTVMLGMNDGYYTDFSADGLKAFQERLEAIVTTLERELPGVRIVFLGSSPYDNVTPGERADWERGIEGGYNSVVAQYGRGMKEVAEGHGLLFVDMNRPLVESLERLQAVDPKLAREMIPDRIHPGPAAGLLMAAELLDAWNAPAAGHTTHVDAAGAVGRVLKARQVLPLPFPLDAHDPLVESLMESSPNMKRFAGDTLRVTGLPFATAAVELDGERIGDFSMDELQGGVNLARLDTALSRRAAEVAGLISLQNELRFARWRDVELAGGGKDSPVAKEAAEKLASIEQRLAKQIDASAEPVPHTIEIIGLDE